MECLIARRIIIGLATFVMASGKCAAAEAVSALDVLKIYQKKYAEVQTLSVEEQITEQAMIPEQTLISDLGWMPPASVSEKVVYHRDGRTFMWRTDPWEKAFDALVKMLTPAFPQLKNKPSDVFKLADPRVSAATKTILQKVPPGERVLVYDGKRLWEHRPLQRAPIDGGTRRVFRIVDVKRAGGRIWFGDNVLNDALFAFPIQIPRDSQYRKTCFLPDLLKALPAEELSKPLAVEMIAGIPSLVLSLKNQRYILDPRFGLSVRRHEETSEGYTVRVYSADKFVEVLPGVWLPSKVEDTLYGSPHEAGGKYAGRPACRRIIEITNPEANNPDHLKYLMVEVPAGALVLDETTPAIDARGKKVAGTAARPNVIPTVQYIQPANQADMENVVHEAQIKAGKTHTQFNSQPIRRVFWVWFSIGFLFGFLNRIRG